MSSDSHLVTDKIPDFRNWKLNEAKLGNMPRLEVKVYRYSNGHVIREEKTITNPKNTIVELIDLHKRESQIGLAILLLSILYDKTIADVKRMLKVEYWESSMVILSKVKDEVLFDCLAQEALLQRPKFKEELHHIRTVLWEKDEGIKYQFELSQKRRSNIQSNLYTTRLQAHTQELRRKGWHEQRYTTRLPATGAPPTLDSFNSF